ncbi:MAG: phosphotransferase, partial [Planctomycetes bacterium]|nr:phosphotransferase [Planctomycetota bacterium]
PRLPHLAECLNRTTMTCRLEALGFPHDSDDAAPRVQARLLAHKPGRRAVILYEIAGEARARLVGKTYRDDRAMRVVEWSRQLAAQFAERGAPVRVPQPLGLDRALKMSLSRWCGGRGENATNRLGPRFSKTAEILSALHDAVVGGLSPFTAEDECMIAARWSKLLRRFEARRADRAERLTERLIAWSRRLSPVPPRTIHRDFYEKQLIWAGRLAHLLDLDTLCAGDPALDIGNFMGNMLLDRASAGLSIRELPALADAFVADYRRTGGAVDSEHAGFYWAASLIRGGAIHSLRDATRAHVRSMWDMAESLLDGGIRVSQPRQSKKGAGR